MMTKINKMPGRPRRDHIDSIRVSLWYENLKLNLSASNSCQLERIIEPEAFGQSVYGVPYHHNKWVVYRSGIHTPKPNLVAAAEFHVSGSSTIINSVLWEVIKGKKKLDWMLKEGIRQLSWDVQNVLYKTNKSNNSSELLPTLTRKNLSRLIRLANLDSLAAQIIFLRVADNRNERTLALKIGQSIYQTLLIMCTYLPFCSSRFCAELIKLMQDYVFPLAHDGEKGIHIQCENQFFHEVRQLCNFRLAMEDRGQVGMSENDGVQATADWLNGKLGFHLQFAFSAPITSKDGRLLSEQRLKQWGQEQLLTGCSEKFPPFDLFSD